MSDNAENNDFRKNVENTLLAIRPRLRADGGDVELVDVDDQGIVTVKLMGACHGCPHARITLQMGIERILKSQVPEVTQVKAV